MTYGLPNDVIKIIKQTFQQDARIEAVWLYGSRAMGNYKPASDIDLCIVAPSMQLLDLHLLENKIDDLNLPWKVDLSLKHQIDNIRLQQHINDKGVLFL